MLGPNTELVEGEVVVEQFVASSISSRIGRILERHAGRAYDPGTSVAVIERRGRMQHARSPAMMRGDPRQAALIGVLLGLAAVGWVLIDRRMSGMDRGPGTDLGSLGFYVTAWVVMMAAMMFPSIIPMVDAYRRVQQARRARGHALPGATAVFVGGYLLAWTVFGLGAYALFALARGLGSSLDGDRVAFYAAGGVLVAAGAYQLTPFKDACLSRCRSPVRFVMEHWRSGVRGAAEMGTRHGLWCIGCCWALMASLFALGVMSVAWMLLVAAMIATEKLLPWKWIAKSTVAVVLVALGLAVAFVPSHVPGLTVPGAGTEHDDMQMQGDAAASALGCYPCQANSRKCPFLPVLSNASP